MIHVGLVGCGVIARRHAQWLRHESQAQLSLLFDPQTAAARALGDEFAPHAAVVDTFDALLAAEPLDAVILCSPTTLHYEQVCRALERNLHVLCEKPLASTRQQIVDLIGRSRTAGRILSIAHQRRYLSVYRTARRELAENAAFYGPLRQFHIFGCERWQQTIAGTWRDRPDVPAGYFGDAGLHHIDVVHFITGQQATSLVAQSHRRGSQVEIATGVLAEMSGGAQLTAHFVGHAHHWREDLHFHGADADLLIRSKGWLDSELFRCRDNQVERIDDLLPDSNPVAGFIAAVLHNTQTVSPPEIALPVYDWIDAAMRSLASGRRERLPAAEGTPVP